MKALRLTVILTLAILLIPHGFLQAVDSKGRFYALGVGERTCREYIELRERRIKDFTPEDYERTNHVVEHWVAGYLTGHNYYVSDTYDVKGNKSIEEIKVWIEGFCRKDQDEYFAEAVIALAAELHDSRKKTGTITEPDRRYLVLYFGLILDLIERQWPIDPKGREILGYSPRRNSHLCTNAVVDLQLSGARPSDGLRKKPCTNES